MPRGTPLIKGQQCTVCTHPKAPSISRDLVLGMSCREAEEKYGCKKDALNRHLRNHVDEAQRRKIVAKDIRDNDLAEHQQIASVINDDRVEIQGGLKRCVKEIEEILKRAKDAGDDPLALVSIKEMRNTLVSLATVYGQLKTSLTVNVALTDSSEWLELRSILVQTFAAYPEAGKAFIEQARKLNISLPKQR